MVTCKACGQPLPDDSRFCGFCGFRLGPLPPVTPDKPRSNRIRIAPEPALSEDVELGMANTIRASLDQIGKVAPQAPSGAGRKFDRYPLRVEVTYSSAHNFIGASAHNIGHGGLFIATVAPLSVGQMVQVEFTIPGLDRPCNVACEVRWVRRPGEVPGAEPGMGLRFLYLDTESERAIAAFIAHREPLQARD